MRRTRLCISIRPFLTPGAFHGCGMRQTASAPPRCGVSGFNPAPKRFICGLLPRSHQPCCLMPKLSSLACLTMPLAMTERAALESRSFHFHRDPADGQSIQLRESKDQPARPSRRKPQTLACCIHAAYTITRYEVFTLSWRIPLADEHYAKGPPKLICLKFKHPL